MIITYNSNNGNIISAIFDPVPDDLYEISLENKQPDTEIVNIIGNYNSSNISLSDFMVNSSGELVERLELDIQDSFTVKVGETLIIDNIPLKSLIGFSGEFIEINDHTLEIETSEVGEFEIVIFPEHTYKQKNIMVYVIENSFET